MAVERWVILCVYYCLMCYETISATSVLFIIYNIYISDFNYRFLTQLLVLRALITFF